MANKKTLRRRLERKFAKANEKGRRVSDKKAKEAKEAIKKAKKK